MDEWSHSERGGMERGFMMCFNAHTSQTNTSALFYSLTHTLIPVISSVTLSAPLLPSLSSYYDLWEIPP